MRHRRHGHVFWRVYLHGVLLLGIVGVTVIALSFALRHGRSGEQPYRLAVYLADRVVELAGTPERIGDELRRVRDAMGMDATLYDAHGGVVATNVDPPLAMRHGAPNLWGRGRWRLTVPLRGFHGHLVISVEGGGDPHRALLFIGAVLVALALASYPLARSIASPVERLTAAARALGGGDLAARANVRAKGELGELGRAFDEMAARLQRLVESERELLANVSHELRTPLARIRVALELAAEGDPERARRHLAGIASDLSELDALVEDVLTAARLDARGSGELPLTRAPLDLAEVVRDAAARFREAHPDRELVVEATQTPLVNGDAALLRRLVANLLDNAAKYSEPPSPVMLALRPDAGAAVLEVRDRGIGVDAADLPRLFTPFFRTDRSRARGTGGTGLGLALAKRIAEAHGGTVAAESAPGAGTTFRVRLPTVSA
ncbi:MAG TPA: HAMP domain-containing sensor histidine kinase [Anaeromyxobacter sp.]|nr:HAMP domain-containing sensor histidine kinase [Anaeromyxobacter sp.]